MKNHFSIILAATFLFILLFPLSVFAVNDPMVYLSSVQLPTTEDWTRVKLPLKGEIEIPWVHNWQVQQGVDIFHVSNSSTRNYHIEFGQPIDELLPRGTGERQYRLERVPHLSKKGFYQRYATGQSLSIHLPFKDIILTQGEGMCNGYDVKIRLPKVSWWLSTSCISAYGQNIATTPYELMRIIGSIK